MQRLVIYALAIDDVRDIFGADEALAERLRGAAAQHFAAAPTKKRWFGPVLRRDPDLVIDPARPTTADAEALLSGGYVAPERQVACWRLLTLWFEELAAAYHEVSYDPANFDQIEWELACLGLGSENSLRSLAERRLGVPLQPLRGQIAGYAKHVHAVDVWQALTAVRKVPELSEGAAVLIDPVIEALAAVASLDRLDAVVVGSA